MPPVIVFRRLKLDGRSIGPEAGEALRAIPTKDMGEVAFQEKERVEAVLSSKGDDLPIVAVSLETLTEEKIKEININPDFAPVEGAQPN